MARRERVIVVMVEPRGGVNLGLVARLIENFGFKKLRLVRPLLTTEEMETAKKFAMRGLHLLEEAKCYDDLGSAIADVDLSIATSARGQYDTLDISRYAVDCERLVKILTKFDGVAAVVLGREDRGLSRDEMELCNLLVTIDPGTAYKTFNVTHAAAIIFYFIARSCQGRRGVVESATRPLLDAMFRYFEKIARSVEPKEFKRKRASLAFKRMVSRAAPTQKEASLVIGILRKAYESLKGLNKQRCE